jgi:GNAT superfamily N-acetyltransferase
LNHTTNKQTKGRTEVCSQFVLKIYDWYILWYNCWFLWKCPAKYLLDSYNQYVSINHLDIGVGEKIFNEILKWFRSKGMDRIELDITSKNYVSSSFWGKLGFEEYVRTLFRDIYKVLVSSHIDFLFNKCLKWVV